MNEINGEKVREEEREGIGTQSKNSQTIRSKQVKAAFHRRKQTSRRLIRLFSFK